MDKVKKTRLVLAMTVLVAGFLSISPMKGYALSASGDSEEVNKLLTNVKSEAHQLETDADSLATYARSGLTPHSQGEHLNIIRHHVNAAGELLSQLEDASEVASPWQQQAIEEIRPMLQDLADNTEAAINHFNENQAEVNLRHPDYQAYLDENFKVAKELAALISDYVDYGQHKANLERLADTLAVPNQ